MEIPKIISKNGQEYIFVKAYTHHLLYKNMITGAKECFTIQDLTQIKNKRLVGKTKWEKEIVK